MIFYFNILTNSTPTYKNFITNLQSTSQPFQINQVPQINKLNKKKSSAFSNKSGKSVDMQENKTNFKFEIQVYNKLTSNEQPPNH